MSHRRLELEEVLLRFEGGMEFVARGPMVKSVSIMGDNFPGGYEQMTIELVLFESGWRSRVIEHSPAQLEEGVPKIEGEVVDYMQKEIE